MTDANRNPTTTTVAPYPGPWRAFEDRKSIGIAAAGEVGRILARMVVYSTHDLDLPDPVQMANARVMAAGWDLLAACHGGPGAAPGAMADNLDFFAGMIAKNDFHVLSRQGVAEILRSYATTLREAIAKATTPTTTE